MYLYVYSDSRIADDEEDSTPPSSPPPVAARRKFDDEEEEEVRIPFEPTYNAAGGRK